MDYYAFLLHIQINESDALFRFGRLFQEFIVDAYTTIEQNRLKWIRFNQDKLSVEKYSNVMNAATDDITDLRNIGTPTVLPSSFISSPRHMIQLLHDSMAVVRVISQPDLFITVTSNAFWPEIMDSLLSGQTAQDRPDLVARVFKLK